MTSGALDEAEYRSSQGSFVPDFAIGMVRIIGPHIGTTGGIGYLQAFWCPFGRPELFGRFQRGIPLSELVTSEAN